MLRVLLMKTVVTGGFVSLATGEEMYLSAGDVISAGVAAAIVDRDLEVELHELTPAEIRAAGKAVAA